MRKDKISVDILMVTYNHEEYIRDAVESVMMQETEYSYRLLIGEDCSKDGTRAIVMELQEKYPDRMEAILHTPNVGMNANYKDLMARADAKYVMILEGDDYWTAPNLIQRHVDYLETHPEHIGILCNSRSVNGKGEPDESLNVFPLFPEYIYDKKYAADFHLAGLMGGLCYRNLKYIMTKEQWDEYYRCKFNDDVKLFVTLGALGDLYCNPDIVVDHRRVIDHGTSWSASTEGKNLTLYEYEGVQSGAEYLKKAYGMDVDVSEKLKALREYAIYLYYRNRSQENRKILAAFCRKGYLGKHPGIYIRMFNIRCRLGALKNLLTKAGKGKGKAK